MDLAQGLIPHHMELGHLLLNLSEVGQGGVDVCPLGQDHLVGQHRFQQGVAGVPLGSQALPGFGAGEAGDGADLAGVYLIGQGEFGPRIQPQLVGLGRPALPFGAAREGILDFQHPAGDPQPGEPGPLVILGDLEHLGAEMLPRRGRAGPAVQPFQQAVHPVHLEGGTKPAGEDVPPGDGGDDIRLIQGLPCQVLVHQVLITEGQGFIPLLLGGAEIHKALPQPAPQLVQQGIPAGAGQVHLVYK